MESKTHQAKKENNIEEKYTKAIGEFGRWQILLFLSIAVPIKLSMPGTHFGIIFIAPKTTFRCLQTNITVDVINSTCYNDCLKYEYYSEFGNTIISQWQLICGREWMANFSQTMLMFGVLVGSAVFGFISDRYGRRPGLLSSCTLQLASSFITPFCPDYWSFIVVRFFLGAATAGSMMASFIFLMEIIGSNKREMLGCLYSLPLAIGQVLMPVVSYYMRTWDQYSLGVAIPNLIFLAYVFFIPESPKWLISVGKLEKASVVMSGAAKFNKLPKEEDMLKQVQTIAEESLTKSGNNARPATYLDLIRLPSLRVKNLCCCVVWFTLGLSFYGSNQFVGQSSTNTFATVAFGGLFQIPGLPISAYLSSKFGRRITIITLSLTSVFGNGLLAIPDEWFYVKLIAGAVGVASGSACYSVIYVYTTELFPTVARNMAMGASSTTTRIGSMLAPFVAGLHSKATWIPPLVFGFVPIIAVVACCCLPETKGKKLEDHLDEA